MNWTKELVNKLKYYVEHRDYIVRVSDLDHNIAKITPVDIVPNPEEYDVVGWFSTEYDPENDQFEIDSYNPEDFQIFKLIEKWE